METVDPTDADSLSLDDLRHLQRTLQRRVGSRDAANIVAVGFGPKSRGGETQEGLAARFFVRRKKSRVAESRRIQPVEPVRLFDRRQGRYRQLQLATDVVQIRPPAPVGVAVRDGTRRATTAAVIRWTTRRPPPPDPQSGDPGDARWRWGLLTVAHLFDGRAPVASSAREVKVDRVDACAAQPPAVDGAVVAAGRLPGGPDAAVMETGIDRLWLSGFLPDPSAHHPRLAAEADVLRWIHQGTDGYVHRAGPVRRWRFATYLPEQTIPGLGRLRHMIQFHSDAVDDALQPLAPGTSGSVLVAGGVPAGMQVAAQSPDYQIGYAQLFAASWPWVRERLAATRVVLVRVV